MPWLWSDDCGFFRHVNQLWSIINGFVFLTLFLRPRPKSYKKTVTYWWTQWCQITELVRYGGVPSLTHYQMNRINVSEAVERGGVNDSEPYYNWIKFLRASLKDKIWHSNHRYSTSKRKYRKETAQHYYTLAYNAHALLCFISFSLFFDCKNPLVGFPVYQYHVLPSCFTIITVQKKKKKKKTLKTNGH